MGWLGTSDAIARVRFETHRSVPSSAETLTEHTAIVLGIFKRHERLRHRATRVDIIERRGFMRTEDGNWPCWANEPLPPVPRRSRSWDGTPRGRHSFSGTSQTSGWASGPSGFSDRDPRVK